MQTVTTDYTKLQYRIVTTCNVTPAYDTDFSPEHVIIVQGKALWDTGATLSAISTQVAQQLQLKPLRKQVMNTANGYTALDMYEVNLELENGIQFNDLLVSAVHLDDVQVLVGMDVIAQGDLAITNGNRHSTLSFQVPATRNIDFEKWDQGKEIQDAIEETKFKMVGRLYILGLSVEKIAEATEKTIDDVISIVMKHKQNDNALTV